MNSASSSRNTGKTTLLFILLAGLTLLFFVLDLSLGAAKIPVGDILSILFGGEGAKEHWPTIIESRLAQSTTALLAGAGLAVCGLQMQTLFRNPLAGPSVLGVSSGASLGVALVVLAAGDVLLGDYGISGNLAIILSAVAGAALVLMGIIALAGKIKDNVTILIGGLMIGYTASAIVSVLMHYSEQDKIQQFVIWGFGSFSGVAYSQLKIFVLVVLVGLALNVLLVKSLNALLLGETYAGSMGMAVKRTRILIILTTGLLAGTITAFCGPIAFLGLAVPHLTRSLFNTSDHRILIPAVILTGTSLALICDLLSRYPVNLPLNAVTSLIGAPVVIWIIIRQRNLKSVM